MKEERRRRLAAEASEREGAESSRVLQELRQRLATGAARAHKVERILAERAAPVVAPEPVIPVRRRRRYLHSLLALTSVSRSHPLLSASDYRPEAATG